MGLWKAHFHWKVLMGWAVLAWTISTLLAIGGLLLVFDQWGANVCFVIVALFVFAKIAHIAITAAADPLWHRLLFTFLLFGLSGVAIVETVRGINNWRNSKQRAATALTIQPSSGIAPPGEMPQAPMPTSEPKPKPLAAPTAKVQKPRVEAAKRKPETDAILNQTADFIDQGSTIQKTFLETNNTDLIVNQEAEWTRRVEVYLEKNLGKSYAVQFRSAHGNAWMGMPANHSIIGGGVWQEIEGKKDALNRLITEVRKH